MKIIIVATGCLVLASCSGSQAPKSVGFADSVSEVTTDSQTVSIEEASVPAFMSDDLKSEALRGQVKKVMIKEGDPEDFMLAYKSELNFNEKGRNITEFYYDNQNDVLKHNSDGILVNISYHPGSDGTNACVRYTSLNEFGHPVKASFSYEGPGVNSVDGTMEFSDYVYDSNQNWTSRKVSATYNFTDFETEAVTKKSDTWTEKRTLLYQ